MVKDEVQLIKKAQAGDVRAFEELAFRYDRQVLSIAYSFRNSEDDAKDIYQEVFLRVFRGIKKFKFKSEFSTWLFRITTNVCISHKSKKQRQQTESLDKQVGGGEEEDSISRSDLIAGNEDTENEVINTDIKGHINRAIEQLPEKQRMAFVLKHYQEYKIKEIADIMQCTEGTIKRYLFTANNKMKVLLKNIV